jgi:hypothetical protein
MKYTNSWFLGDGFLFFIIILLTISIVFKAYVYSQFNIKPVSLVNVTV